MYRAAIVEDEADVRRLLHDSFEKVFQENSIPVHFELFSSGTEFMEIFDDHTHYDLVFMDIELPGMNGLEICRRIRLMDSQILIVFISGRDELVFQSFSVQPFRFVRKSDFLNVLPDLTQAITSELIKRSQRIITIREPVSGEIYSFDLQMIQYIEALGKSCRIVSENNIAEVKCKFMDLEKQLEGTDFLKVHRSYLVHCRYIYHIGRTSLKMTTGKEIPISRNRISEIQTAFLDYWT